VPTATVKRLWPAVAPCFQPAAQEGGRLINRRLERERKKQRAFRRRQVDNGKKGGRPPKPEKPPDNPSLSQPGKPAAPIWQSSDLISSDLISSHLSSAEKTAAEEPTNARSKRPIFTSSRFVVFEWQFDDLRRLLGPSFDAFDIHEWFFELSKKADAAALVIPQRDGGKWLQEQTMAEAVRRGLPVAISAAAPVGKTAGNAAAKALFVARGQR
jgi:hypothetical protein